MLDATVGLRAFLFEAVYENEVATAEFKKAAGILGGLWDKVREQPDVYLDLEDSRSTKASTPPRGTSSPG